LLAPDSTKFPLLASSRKDFLVRGFYLFISFEKDAGGKVTGAHVEQFGGKAFMTKTR